MAAHPDPSAQIQRELAQLFYESLALSTPLQQLHLIREKIQARGLQSFDGGDIMNVMGQLQQVLRELDRRLLTVHDLIAK